MYLPPQEIDQVRSLLSIIGDPKSAQKLLDKLIETDGTLDQKKADIDKIADEARNNFEAESRKAQELQDEAKSQLDIADQRLQKAIALEVSVKAESQKNDDYAASLITMQDKSAAFAIELANRESNVSQRERNASLKETALADQENSLAQRQQDLDARFAKLREAAQ